MPLGGEFDLLGMANSSPDTLWSFLNFYMPFFDGLIDKVGNVAGSQFVKEAFAMSLNSILRDKQLFCNLLRGVPFCH